MCGQWVRARLLSALPFYAHKHHHTNALISVFTSVCLICIWVDGTTHYFTSANSEKLKMSNNQRLFMRAAPFLCHWFDSVMHCSVWSLRQNALRKRQMYFIFNNIDLSLLSHRLEFKQTIISIDTDHSLLILSLNSSSGMLK